MYYHVKFRDPKLSVGGVHPSRNFADDLMVSLTVRH